MPCCSCVLGPITVDVRLEKEAFVLGEIVKVDLQIKNASNECIVTTRVQLIQVSKYKLRRIFETLVFNWVLNLIPSNSAYIGDDCSHEVHINPI